ncbi:MAG: hypothetical protein P8X68_12000 [Desulfobacterales bacterium]|jgi:hypothetical protein
MKKIFMPLSLSLALSLLIVAPGCQPDKNSPEAVLKNVDAFQAMAIANEWKWSKKEIKSYVNTREIVFELPDSKAIKIALPEDKMLVAVAPYINQTHQ